MNYEIKAGYKHRLSNVAVDTTSSSDKWQREVYERAASVAHNIGAKRVLDVGCGSGYKLLKYFGKLETVGTELEPMLSALRENHPDREWVQSDLASPPDGHFDVIVCADVVEHIPDPDVLMDYLNACSFSRLFISTPERKLVYGADHSGPPKNAGHCREWLMDEFARYVSRWFTVSRHTITNYKQATQMVEIAR